MSPMDTSDVASDAFLINRKTNSNIKAPTASPPSTILTKKRNFNMKLINVILAIFSTLASLHLSTYAQ